MHSVPGSHHVATRDGHKEFVLVELVLSDCFGEAVAGGGLFGPLGVVLVSRVVVVVVVVGWRVVVVAG